MAAEAAIPAANEAETEAACVLSATAPTTAEGKRALMNYILYRQKRGDVWPDSLIDDEGNAGDWHFFIIESLLQSDIS